MLGANRLGGETTRGAKRLGGKRPGGKRLGGEKTRGGNGLGAKRPGFIWCPDRVKTVLLPRPSWIYSLILDPKACYPLHHCSFSIITVLGTTVYARSFKKQVFLRIATQCI